MGSASEDDGFWEGRAGFDRLDSPIFARLPNMVGEMLLALLPRHGESPMIEREREKEAKT